MAMDDTTLYSGLVVVAGSIAPELEPEENWRSTLDKKWLRWVLPTSFRVSNQEILPAKEQLDLMVPLWPRIKIPVRFLHGTKDNLVAVENVDFGEKVLVNCEVNCQILEGDNHFIPFDDPQLVVQEILASRR
jgi:pimeloyl-ACP methyl ester carboxylesterase